MFSKSDPVRRLCIRHLPCGRREVVIRLYWRIPGEGRLVSVHLFFSGKQGEKANMFSEVQILADPMTNDEGLFSRIVAEWNALCSEWLSTDSAIWAERTPDGVTRLQRIPKADVVWMNLASTLLGLALKK